MFRTLVALALLAACHASGADYTAIIAFGDSYTDTGRGASSSPPDYWDGRFSNGRLWIEYLSQTLGFAYNEDNNYAVSGTESDELGVAIAKFPGTTDSNGVLFAIWSGNNDFQSHLDQGTNDVYWGASVAHTVSSLTNSCGLLYQKGARNVVLFNQIDITQLPIFRENYSTNFGEYILGEITNMNSQLESALGPLLSANPGLQIYMVDAYDDFNYLLANYLSYGFSNDTIGAINDPNLSNISFTGPGADFVFWDDQHPTTKTHDLISGWVANVLGISSTPSDLTVQIQGNGTVSPNYNGKRLQMGKSYTMMAAPEAGFAFTGWTDGSGTALTTSRQLNFTMDADLTLVATFADVTPPTVTVTSPGSDVTQPTLLVKGTARDNVGLAGVFCQLNGGGWQPVSSANGFTNWNTTLQLSGGVNKLQFYSIDLSGNTSKTSSVSVVYIVTSALILATNGTGKITRNFAGDLLVVGKSYTVTALPAANNLFSNWSAVGPDGEVTLTNNPLTFTMQSNMLVTANFVTNSFLEATGEYNGLFYVAATGVSEETAGQLHNFKVSLLGGYSGQLLIGGESYSLSGRFNVAGMASVTVPRPRPAGPLLLELALNWNTLPCHLTGLVSGTNGGFWSAELVAELAGNELPSAAYTMLFPPQAAESGAAAPGYGYAAITNHNGMVTLSGALADGASFNQTVAVSTTGDVPVYASLYSRAGLLLGWLNLTNGSPAGGLVWIKQAAKTSAAYSGGFTNSIQALWSPWINPPPGLAAIPMTNGQLTISGPEGLTPQLSFNVQVNTKNQLVKLANGSPSNLLTGSINSKNGVWTIAFGNGTGRATTQGMGVFLQNTTNAGGFFVGATSAGSITLAPELP
jgi:uncharacterized repeat protein (TIGR02543 family)